MSVAAYQMKKAELVFIPCPGRGHLVSMVELAKLLVARDHRLCVTVLVMQLPFDTMVKAYIDSLASSSSNTSERIKFVDLPQSEKVYTEPNPVVYATSFIEDQKSHVKNAVAELVTTGGESTRLAGFVIDMFCTPMIDVADEFGVPTYVFFASGAGFLGLLLYCQEHCDHRGMDITKFEDDQDSELAVPSFINSVPSKVLPVLLVDKAAGPVTVKHAGKIRKTKGILVNTFFELENHALQSLSDGQSPPVYPVGPVLNLRSDEAVQSGGVNSKSNHIIEWLDEQPPLSVVFLCFGSMGSFSDDQVKEIAYALEHSGQRFLWSLRQAPQKGKMAIPTDFADYERVLPKEFLDRTVNRGKVIGWAPQVDILAHPAIGGFVSHCGWNSTLESLWFGVPVATWPIFAEQQLNAFQMLKEFGCAVEITLDYRREFHDVGHDLPVVGAQQIEAGIRKVMEHDSKMRKRVKEISEMSRKSLMVGGSSYSSLDRLIIDILDNLH